MWNPPPDPHPHHPKKGRSGPVEERYGDQGHDVDQYKLWSNKYGRTDPVEYSHDGQDHDRWSVNDFLYTYSMGEQIQLNTVTMVKTMIDGQ